MTLLYLHSNCCSPTVTCVQKKIPPGSRQEKEDRVAGEEGEAEPEAWLRFPPHRLIEALFIVCLLACSASLLLRLLLQHHRRVHASVPPSHPTCT